jgi:hypothetical protein
MTPEETKAAAAGTIARNGNLHLEFLRPDLVQQLNMIGGKGLPTA